MISDRDIIIIGIQPWDTPIGSNCKNIAEEFAKENRVLYVNEPLHRLEGIKNGGFEEAKRRRQIVSGNKTGLIPLSNNLWTLYPKGVIESINWIPPSPLYSFLNKRNNEIFYDEINQAIKTLNFDDIIVFNDSLIFLGFYATEMLRPSLSIYYIRDNLVSQDYFARHGKQMEPLLSAKYDAIVANSDYLANYLKPFNERTFMVGQGCDFSLFDHTAVSEPPKDMIGIPKPIVGYIGALTSLRLDIPLIEFMASNMEKGSIVLVGPEDETFKRSKLHKMENIHFLGNKGTQELPSYVAAFDVAINPQKVNELTIGNYPRKVDEYLAMGKPVVATYTEAMTYFEEFVYLSRGKKEFLMLIQKAIEEDSPSLAAARIEFATSHTWENNVNNIYSVMERAQEEKALSKASKLAESLITSKLGLNLESNR